MSESGENYYHRDATIAELQSQIAAVRTEIDTVKANAEAARSNFLIMQGTANELRIRAETAEAENKRLREALEPTELQAAICDALLNAFPMADKSADNYAGVAAKTILRALSKSKEQANG